MSCGCMPSLANHCHLGSLIGPLKRNPFWPLTFAPPATPVFNEPLSHDSNIEQEAMKKYLLVGARVNPKLTVYLDVVFVPCALSHFLRQLC